MKRNVLERVTYKIVVLVTMVAIAVAIIGPVYAIESNINEYIVTIDEKQVKRNGDDDNYILFTTLDNGETRVFKNTDDIFKFKFNSSDIQAELKEGKTYKIKTCGYRINCISWYENIIDIKEVDKEAN